MNDEIFNLFTILRPKKQKYSSSSKMAAVKWVLKTDKINHSLPQCSSSLKTDCKESQQPNQSPGNPQNKYKTKREKLLLCRNPIFRRCATVGRRSERLYPLPFASASALCLRHSPLPSTLCPLPPSPPPPPPPVCESKILTSTKPLNILMF